MDETDMFRIARTFNYNS